MFGFFVGTCSSNRSWPHKAALVFYYCAELSPRELCCLSIECCSRGQYLYLKTLNQSMMIFAQAEQLREQQQKNVQSTLPFVCRERAGRTGRKDSPRACDTMIWNRELLNLLCKRNLSPPMEAVLTSEPDLMHHRAGSDP